MKHTNRKCPNNGKYNNTYINMIQRNDMYGHLKLKLYFLYIYKYICNSWCYIYES